MEDTNEGFLTLLDLNGFLINATDKEFADVIYGVASGSDGESYEDFLAWVNAHTSVAFAKMMGHI